MSGDAPYGGVVFDMDGILIDSEPLIRMAAQTAARDIGYPLSDETYMGWMGLPPRAVEAAIRESLGTDFPMDEFRERFRAIWRAHTETHGVPAQPGMAGLLEALTARGVPFAVATSTQRDQAERSLALAGLAHHIKTLVAGNEVANGKPEPEIFLRAAAGIGIVPERCIALEDSAVGVRSAASAGMLTIMVPDLHRPTAEVAALARYVLPTTRRAAAVVMRIIDHG
jgi:HAD superfamily hydrolase (TIGR01509 family)